MSITCLPSAFDRQSSSAAANVWPCGWMTKSTWQVVPPNAAAVCPDSTSSIVTVPPNGMSRCVCGSMQPGSTYLPARVDHPVGRRGRATRRSARSLVLDVEIRDVVVCGGDDAAASNQNRHCAPPFGRAWQPLATGARHGSAFLLPARLERDADRLVALAVHVDALDWFFSTAAPPCASVASYAFADAAS